MAPPMILPKGIVVNSPEIYQDIARMALQPITPDEIFKFWKVYTTTQRMLKDPTALRLENLFWRIWGSRKTKLGELSSAKIVEALIYISSGSTAAGIGTLRSTANRDESGVPERRKPPRLTAAEPSASSVNGSTLKPPVSTFSTKNDRHKKRKSQDLARTAQLNSAHLQNPSNHAEPEAPVTRSMQAPTSHPAKTPVALLPPILKKVRGPSSSGPRPTARFVSPTQSENEYEDVIDDTESEESPNSNVVVRPPTPNGHTSDHKVRSHVAVHRKVRSGHGHGHATHGVVSKAQKKRPTLSKRLSSQSSAGSTGSDSAVLLIDSAAQQSVVQPHQPPKVSPIVAIERPKVVLRQQSRFSENFSPETSIQPKSNVTQLRQPQNDHNSTKKEEFVAQQSVPAVKRQTLGSTAAPKTLTNGIKRVDTKENLSSKSKSRELDHGSGTGRLVAHYSDQSSMNGKGKTRASSQDIAPSTPGPPMSVSGLSLSSQAFDAEQMRAAQAQSREDYENYQTEIAKTQSSRAARQAPEASPRTTELHTQDSSRLSKRSASALNLSAASKTNGKSQFKAPMHVSTSYATPTTHIASTDIVSDDSAAGEEPKPRKLSRVLSTLDWTGSVARSAVKSPATLSSSPASSMAGSFMADRAANRSMSNLSSILQRHDAAKQRKASYDIKR